MTGTDVELTLATLDDSTRDDARAAIGSLLPDDGDWSDLLQITVQGFLWYELPVKWFTGSAHHHEIAWALGDLFDAGGLTRYSAICRSGTTHTLIARWASDEAGARRQFRTLMADSGVSPPDTPLLTWGTFQGEVEHRALYRVSATLEAAVAEGSLVPGGRGWRSAAAQVTVRALRDPDPDPAPDGSRRTLLASIEDERLHNWLADLRPRTAPAGTSPDPLTAVLASPLTDAELHAVAASLEPFSWFLREIGDGVLMTDAGYLPRSLALEADARYDWFPLKPRISVRGERDLPELIRMHELARAARLVTLRGRRLTVSARGREALADPPTLVRAVMSTILDPSSWEGDAAIATTLTLLRADPATPRTTADLDAAVHAHLKTRWQAGDAQLALSHVLGAGARLHAAARTFGWYAPTHARDWAREPELSAVGRLAARAGIRDVACAPRS